MKINGQKIYDVCDYIPVVSSVTNLVNVYQIIFVLPKLDNPEILKSRHYTQLKLHGILRYTLLIFFPLGGNFLVGFYDFVIRKNNDPDYIKELIKKKGIQEIQSASSSLKNNPVFMEEVLKQSRPQTSLVLGAVGTLLRNNPDFMKLVIDLNWDWVFENMGKEIIENDFLKKLLLSKNGVDQFLDKIGSKCKNGNMLKNNQAFIGWCLDQIPDFKAVLAIMGDDLRKNASFVQVLLERYKGSVQFDYILEILDDSVKNNRQFSRWLLDTSGSVSLVKHQIAVPYPETD